MRLIDADALLEALKKYQYYGYITDLITNAPTVQREGWVSVEDKLPKQLDIVLVLGKHKSEKSRSAKYELVDTATYYDWTPTGGDKGWFSPRFRSDYDEVTHWQLLPSEPTDKE